MQVITISLNRTLAYYNISTILFKLFYNYQKNTEKTEKKTKKTKKNKKKINNSTIPQNNPNIQTNIHPTYKHSPTKKINNSIISVKIIQRRKAETRLKYGHFQEKIDIFKFDLKIKLLFKSKILAQ